MRLSKKISYFRKVGAVLLATAGLSAAADLPTAKSVAAEMGVAWNIGNTMEVPKDPTAWGNPIPTQRLIDSVKAAGFKSIRIPCAWYSHTESDSLTIKPAWMAQVKAVVDYAIKDSLFVVLNSHWDLGWLEERVDTTKAVRDLVNRRQGAYWRQIATVFKGYGRHLVLASANEPGMQDKDGVKFEADRMAVLNSYHQTFIDTVRATGGNNASRTLIVQGPHTDIGLTNTVMTTMPTDKIAGRLMAEVHFYPYQFSLMEKPALWWGQDSSYPFFYWGKGNHSTTDVKHNPTWGEEAFVDSMFNLMKVQFVDKDIPVLLGEFGAIKRTDLTGDTLALHILSRRAFYAYTVKSALSKGIVPAVWDAGFKGLNTMTVFDRATGSVYDLGLLNAIRSGAGLSKLAGDTSLVPVAGANAMRVLYSAKDSLFGQVDLGVAQPDFSQYDSIQVKVYAKGNTSYDSAGIAKYGFVSLSLVTMSDSADKSYVWREVSLGSPTMNAWKSVSVPVSTDKSHKTALVPADPTKVKFFALQMYSKGFNGAIYVDYVAFKKKAGTVDTLYSFNLSTPEAGKGNVETVKMVPVASVAGDEDWKTATKAWKDTSKVVTPTGNKVMKLLYSAKDSLFGQVDLGVVQPDFSQYDSIQVKVYAKGKTTYDSAGVTKYGFVSLSLVTMSDSADQTYLWREVSLGSPTMDAWKTFSVPVSTDKADKTALVPADPTNVKFFALQMYSKGFNGAIYVDYIAFKKTGKTDTLYGFDATVPTKGAGNVVAVKSLAASSVAADADWKTLTKAYVPAGIATRMGARGLSARVAGGTLTAVWNATEAGSAVVSLLDLQGRTLRARSVSVGAGLNSLALPVTSRGLQVLQIRQGERTLTAKVLAD